jgi:UDP-N-acetylmuramyl pentapeptide synthase
MTTLVIGLLLKDQAVVVVRWLVKHLARATVWRYRPAIVAVTGSVGKTSTKYAVGAVLAADRSVRISRGNFNNELGVSLGILGDWGKIAGLFFWPKVILMGLWRLIVKSDYPELLVLEYGIDRPGDMKQLIAIAEPNVSVMTAIGDVPAHVEFFGSPEQVAREKGRIIECLAPASFAVLCGDSPMTVGLRERTRARVVTYGFNAENDVRISDFENRIAAGRPAGISFRVGYAGNTVLVELDGVFGRAHAYAAAAGAAIGLVFAMPLGRIAEALRGYRPPAGRMQLISGPNDTLFLNDAYNASPLSMQEALATLKSIPAKRRIAVLGDMLEIGAYAMDEHRTLGERAAKAVNILITVGPRARFIAEGARKAGLRKNYIFSYDTAEEAIPKLSGLLKPGDVTLFKASHAVGLEKLAQLFTEKYD